VVAEGAADLDRLARAAAGGDKRALVDLCRELQHPIYRLALRMLSSPEDAEDATQEVLVRIVTNLGTFEGRSRFMTWVYTVATRQLLRTRKRLVESSVRGADAFAAALDTGLGPVPTTSRGMRSTRSSAPR
jgi:DNA-directed RNA polymerase specialized sigma24 family protein